jgi:hypothetical protein
VVTFNRFRRRNVLTVSLPEVWRWTHAEVSAYPIFVGYVVVEGVALKWLSLLAIARRANGRDRITSCEK